MPYKNRKKQLDYMKEYARQQREELKNLRKMFADKMKQVQGKKKGKGK